MGQAFPPLRGHRPFPSNTSGDGEGKSTARLWLGNRRAWCAGQPRFCWHFIAIYMTSGSDRPDFPRQAESRHSGNTSRMAFYRPGRPVTACTASARGMTAINRRIPIFFQHPFAGRHWFVTPAPSSLPLSGFLLEAPRPPASADRQKPPAPWLRVDPPPLRVR